MAYYAIAAVQLDVFQDGVSCGAGMARESDSIAEAWLAADARRGGDTPLTGTVEPG